MKKILVVVLMVVLTAGGVLWYRHASVPRSHRIIEEMRSVLNGPGDPREKVRRYDELRDQLFDAYTKEERYDAAISVLTREIESERERAARSGGPRPSYSYDHEAAQFNLIAITYERKGDEDSASKARKKADEAEAASKRAAKHETPRKSILD